MKILDRLSSGLTGRSPATPTGETKALSFRSRMRSTSPLRAASWRQLLRINRETQVDPLIGPPTPPPGYTAKDAVEQRSFLRNAIRQRSEDLRSTGNEPANPRRQAVQRMLDLLSEQQRQQDAIVARSAHASSGWQ